MTGSEFAKTSSQGKFTVSTVINGDSRPGKGLPDARYDGVHRPSPVYHPAALAWYNQVVFRRWRLQLTILFIVTTFSR